MPVAIDGPVSSLFTPASFKGNIAFSDMKTIDIWERVKNAVDFCPSGSCICRGIPFEVADPVWVEKEPVTISFDNVEASWLVMMHVIAVFSPPELDSSGFEQSSKGWGQLGDHVADYIFIYADESEERIKIKKRHQIGYFGIESCMEAVSHVKPTPAPGGRGEGTTITNEAWVGSNHRYRPMISFVQAFPGSTGSGHGKILIRKKSCRFTH